MFEPLLHDEPPEDLREKVMDLIIYLINRIKFGLNYSVCFRNEINVTSSSGSTKSYHSFSVLDVLSHSPVRNVRSVVIMKNAVNFKRSLF